MYAGFPTIHMSYIWLISLPNLPHICLIIRLARRTLRVDKNLFLPHKALNYIIFYRIVELCVGRQFNYLWINLFLYLRFELLLD